MDSERIVVRARSTPPIGAFDRPRDELFDLLRREPRRLRLNVHLRRDEIRETRRAGLCGVTDSRDE